MTNYIHFKDYIYILNALNIKSKQSLLWWKINSIRKFANIFFNNFVNLINSKKKVQNVKNEWPPFLFKKNIFSCFKIGLIASLWEKFWEKKSKASLQEKLYSKNDGFAC